MKGTEQKGESTSIKKKKRKEVQGISKIVEMKRISKIVEMKKDNKHENEREEGKRGVDQYEKTKKGELENK